MTPVDRAGPHRRRRRCVPAVAAGPGERRAITTMWANNEVGTVQPIAEVVAIAREHGIPVHSDAVQAAGYVPLDFAAVGLDAMTITAHKLGGPVGVGALLIAPRARADPAAARRRPGARSALGHHRRRAHRRVREGRRASRVGGQAETVARIEALRAAAHRGHPAGRARRDRQRRSDAGPAAPAAQHRPRHLPGLRGRRAADAARRPGHRVLDRIGLRGRRAAAQPRAAGHGLRRRSPRAARCGSASGTPRPRPTSTP